MGLLGLLYNLKLIHFMLLKVGYLNAITLNDVLHSGKLMCCCWAGENISTLLPSLLATVNQKTHYFALHTCARILMFTLSQVFSCKLTLFVYIGIHSALVITAPQAFSELKGSLGKDLLPKIEFPAWLVIVIDWDHLAAALTWMW